jgi:hypothetical protein
MLDNIESLPPVPFVLEKITCTSPLKLTSRNDA